MVKILVLRNKATIWSPHGIIIMPKHSCERPREVSPLRDHRSFDTVYEYKQYLAQRCKQQETLRDSQRDRSSGVRVRSASESRLSGVRRLPPRKPPKQLPPRQPSSTRRGSVQQRSSGWQHTQAARVCMMFCRTASGACTAFCISCDCVCVDAS